MGQIIAHDDIGDLLVAVVGGLSGSPSLPLKAEERTTAKMIKKQPSCDEEGADQAIIHGDCTHRRCHEAAEIRKRIKEIAT